MILQEKYYSKTNPENQSDNKSENPTKTNVKGGISEAVGEPWVPYTSILTFLVGILISTT